jgi:hypothetical protein
MKKYVFVMALALGGLLSASSLADAPAERGPEHLREAPLACTDKESQGFDFHVSFDSTRRMDKIGNACSIVTTWLASADHCSKIDASCTGNEHEVFRVLDPWRRDEFVDIPCRVLMEACLTGSDQQEMQQSCVESMSSMLGYRTDDDPGPLSFLISAGCGLLFYGAAGTGCRASGATNPPAPDWLGGGSLCQFGAGTFLGMFAYAAIGFVVPF